MTEDWNLFKVAGWLCFGAVVFLVLGIMAGPAITSYLDEEYTSAGSHRYYCSGTPEDVADDIAADQRPSARTTDDKTKTEYLRYDDSIVSVGPNGGQPCSIRLETLDDGYNQGHYTYLGPGFYPGSPASSAGGDSGGPDGAK